jgi:CheY-like chemotaxis protein
MFLLLVEDDLLTLFRTQDVLESRGYFVLTAESGAEALRIVDAHADELSMLVTDVNLGEGPDGWQVARLARAVKEDIPVIYTTGDAHSEWLLHGVPGSVLLAKPVLPACLLASISSLLREGVEPTGTSGQQGG